MTTEEILIELVKTNSNDEKTEKMLEILKTAKESENQDFVNNAMKISKLIF